MNSLVNRIAINDFTTTATDWVIIDNSLIEYNKTGSNDIEVNVTFSYIATEISNFCFNINFNGGLLSPNTNGMGILTANPILQTKTFSFTQNNLTGYNYTIGLSVKVLEGYVTIVNNPQIAIDIKEV